MTPTPPQAESEMLKRERLLDTLMHRMPLAFATRWCTGRLCACLGCAGVTGGLHKAGFTKEEWETWWRKFSPPVQRLVYNSELYDPSAWDDVPADFDRELENEIAKAIRTNAAPSLEDYADAWRVYAAALRQEVERLREERAVTKAAIELESYLAKVNTQERQSIVFQTADDDPDGLAIAGLCERLTKLSVAIRALSASAGGEGPRGGR